MSTRACIAIQQGDGWRGRFTHLDGYPSAMGRDLMTLVQREGVERVREVMLEEHPGWETVDPDRVDLKGVRLASNATYGTYEYGSLKEVAWTFRKMYKGLVNVPGWGIAYPRSHWNVHHWVSSEDEYNPLIEWVYVLGDKGLTVLELHSEMDDRTKTLGSAMLNRGHFPYDLPNAVDIVASIDGTPYEETQDA